MVLTTFLLLLLCPSFSNAQANPSVPRGISGDLWADLILGQPDDGDLNYAFSEDKPNQAVSNRTFNASSVVVDRVHGFMYVWDSGNNRILGMNLSKLQPNASPSDPGFEADIVLGQKDFTRTACNHDSNWQNHPAIPVPDENCLCGQFWAFQSPLEAQSGGNMAVDSQGNLYVPDYFNNRVLRYDYQSGGITTGQPASHVWGQPDFHGYVYNNDGTGQTGAVSASNLDFMNVLSGGVNDNSYMAGVAVDDWGNLWVADESNNRVLRYPNVGGLPSTTADLVLGQNLFTTNAPNTGGTGDLSHLYQPVAVRVDSFGTLYVAERSNSYGRVLLFQPTNHASVSPSVPPVYTSGQAALTQITQNLLAPVGLELDPTEATGSTAGLWVADELPQAVMYRIDYGTGSPVPTASKVLLTDQPGVAHGGTTPDGASTFTYISGQAVLASTMVDTLGSVGVDNSGNVYIADHRLQDVWRFPQPVPTIQAGILHSADIQIFKPNSYGEQNEYGDKSFIVPAGVAVAAAGGVTQIIVSDALRLSFWNIPPGGIASMSNGESETGYAGTNLPFVGVIGRGFGRIQADEVGHLWTVRNPESTDANNPPIIEVYSLPLPASPAEVTPVATLVPGIPILGVAGSGISWTVVEGIAPAPDGSSVWLSDRITNKVFRVRNPLGVAPGSTPVVDIVLGQPNANGTMANYPSGVPSATNLSHPGALALDHHGYLYVSDHALENDGNYRMLRWNKSTLDALAAQATGSNLAQFAAPADGVFGTNRRFDTQGCYAPLGNPAPGICGPWEPAFTSDDSIMVVGQNSQGAGLRFPVVFTNPETGDYPVTSLQDFGPQTFAETFDSQDNLYAVEYNRNRLLVYDKPFLNAYPTPTPTPACCQAAATMVGQPSSTLLGELVIGGTLYVADFSNNLIQKFNTTTGAQAGALSGLGFNGPDALATDGTYLYVADYWGHDVKKVDLASSTVVATVPSTANPRGVAVNSNGDLFISTEGGPGQVQVFQQTSSNVYSQAASITSSQGLSDPMGLLLVNGSPNTLYVGDLNNGQVLAFTQNGYNFTGPTTVLSFASGDYYQFALDGSGNFYLSTATAVKVYRPGFIHDHDCVSGYSGGQGVALDAQGFLYISGNDGGTWKVKQISPCFVPSTPTWTFISSPTSTPTPYASVGTSTTTWTPTPSPTATTCVTPTNSPTPQSSVGTMTLTWTPSPSSTVTADVTPTNSPTPLSSVGTMTTTWTPTITFAAITNSPTIMNTPTITGTPTSTPTNCGAGSGLNLNWTNRSLMPTGRLVFGVGAVNGVLYAVGGEGAGYLSVVEAYDPASDSWSTKAPMPTPRRGLGVGVINGILYAVGGSNGSGSLNTLEAYDPSSNTWSEKASMPTARAQLAVGVVNGILYAIGGDNTNVLEAYNPSTDSWSSKAPMPTARGYLAAGVVNGILYAVGGSNTTGYLNNVEAYDPSLNSWTSKAPISVAREGLAAGAINGILYVVGGSVVEGYDPLSNTWSTKTPLLTPRSYLGLGVVNGALYALGGINSILLQNNEMGIPGCSLNTDTPTFTGTPTYTNTSTPTPTGTLQWTATMTFTPVPTATIFWTSTDSNTPTGSPTNAFSPNPTATSTGTSTDSNTPTDSPTNTFSPNPTATSTWTSTDSNTPTAPPTNTSTPNSTATSTWTSTGSHTPTLTSTATSTPNPSATSAENHGWAGGPWLYPNPSDGRTPVKLHGLKLAGPTDVNVRLFTLAFRKVRELNFLQVDPGGELSIPLTDQWNVTLSNGLYYVVVTTKQDRWILKLIVLR